MMGSSELFRCEHLTSKRTPKSWSSFTLSSGKKVFLVLLVFNILIEKCLSEIEPKSSEYEDLIPKSNLDLKQDFQQGNSNKNIIGPLKVISENDDIRQNPLDTAQPDSFAPLDNSLSDNGGDSTDNQSDVSPTTPTTNLGFVHAFVACLTVILVSELGDKTFFIAAIMAMRHPRLIIFAGAIAALGLMTVLSAVFGMAATIIPRVYTYYISTALFAIFGLKMLKDGYYMKPTDAQEELEEVQMDLRKREDEKLKKSMDQCDSINDEVSEAAEILLTSNDGQDIHDNLPLNDEQKTIKRSEIVDDNQPAIIQNETISPNRETLKDMRGERLNLNQKFYRNALSTTNSDRISNSVDDINYAKNNNYISEIHKDNNNMMPSTSTNSNNNGKSAKNVLSTSSTALNESNMELRQIVSTKKRLDKEVSSSLVDVQDIESGNNVTNARKMKNNRRSGAYLTSRIFIQAFTMTFLAEWGDRSQLTTIILSARENIYGIIVGGILGHMLCTGLAVLGGRMIAQKISVRTVTIIGGLVFIIFAISALFFDPNEA